eukprot:jgi/Tetstr1/453963/TSEL_040882.t1
MAMFTDFVRDTTTRGDGKKVRVPGRLEFTVSGQDVALVSGLRRAIMTDVKIAAFRFDAVDPAAQDVRVSLNTGSLHNEIIGERVGLLPLHLDKAALLDFRPAAWRFEIDVENTGSKPLDVTTADISIVPTDDAAAADAATTAARVFRADPITGRHPIVTVLMPGQRLALEATATLGSGHEHARFNPVAACAMFPLQDKAAVDKARRGREDKATFDALDAKRIVLRDAAGAPAAHRFCLETQCGMSAEEVVEAGYEALASRLRALADATDGTARVHDVPPQTGSPPDIHSLKLSGEDHTSGALVQTKLLEKTDFAGYYLPHLLERAIVVRIRVPPGATARGMLKEACESAADLCEHALAEWQKTANPGK